MCLQNYVGGLGTTTDSVRRYVSSIPTERVRRCLGGPARTIMSPPWRTKTKNARHQSCTKAQRGPAHASARRGKVTVRGPPRTGDAEGRIKNCDVIRPLRTAVPDRYSIRPSLLRLAVLALVGRHLRTRVAARVSPRARSVQLRTTSCTTRSYRLPGRAPYSVCCLILWK